MLDDFSLREGTIADYRAEFRVRPAEDSDFFPIFGWLIPFAGTKAQDRAQGRVTSGATDRFDWHLSDQRQSRLKKRR